MQFDFIAVPKAVISLAKRFGLIRQSKQDVCWLLLSPHQRFLRRFV